jgi:hypothetical protein
MVHTARSSNQSHLLQLQDHNRVIQRDTVRMDLGKTQSRLCHESFPLLPRPLLTAQQDYHRNVAHGGMPVHVNIRENDFVDQDTRLTTHGGCQVLQDFDAQGVRSVVQDSAEVVEFGPFTMSVSRVFIAS